MVVGAFKLIETYLRDDDDHCLEYLEFWVGWRWFIRGFGEFVIIPLLVKINMVHILILKENMASLLVGVQCSN